MSPTFTILANDPSPPDPVKRPRRMILRLSFQTLLVVVACTAMVIWTVRKVSDELSPVRDAARRVNSGVNFDRQEAIETLLQASGEEIDTALPALIKLEASAGPDDRGKLLIGMTYLIIERLKPIPYNARPPAPETAAWQARSVVEAVFAALKSPDDATRAWAAQSLRTALRPEGILAVFATGNDRTGPVDTDTLLGALESAAADPLPGVRQNVVEALANLGAALDREPPPALRLALRDPSTAVRNTAAVGVAGFKKGIDPCLTDLFQVMADNRPEGEAILSVVRDRCYSAIWEAKPEPTAAAVPILTAALDSPHGAVRGAAAMLLGRIGPDAAATVPGLVAALRRSLDPAARNEPDSYASWHPSVIAAALQQIEPQGPTVQREVVPMLVNGMGLDEPYARSGAALALPVLGPTAEPAVPALIEMVGNKGHSSETPEMAVQRREMATRALVQIARGTPSAGQARTALEAALKNGLIRRDMTRWLDTLNAP